MGDLVRLDEWAKKRGRSASTVRRFWVTRPGFPQRKDTGLGVSSGKPFDLFDEDELDAFAERWEAERRPAPLAVPPEPESFRTLGAIARLLGMDGRTVTQYRALIDQRADHEDRGQRRFYRTRQVVEVLNSRRGAGVAREPGKDQRRTSRTRPEPSTGG